MVHAKTILHQIEILKITTEKAVIKTTFFNIFSNGFFIRQSIHFDIQGHFFSKIHDFSYGSLFSHCADTRGLFLKTGPNLYNIDEFQSKIEHSLIRDNLLVLHGLFGSDCMCTLAFFGHPSYNSLSMKWEHLARKLAVFRGSNATLNEVHDAGVKLITAMYRCDVNLNLERARMFKEGCNDNARKKKINFEWLPPNLPTSEGLGWELFESRIFWVAHGIWYSGADTYAAGTGITFPH